VTDSKQRKKPSYVHAPSLFLLSQACIPLVQAFDVPYLVGSSLQRPDFRDVDVRLILPDEEYDALFPGSERGIRGMLHARWSVIVLLDLPVPQPGQPASHRLPVPADDRREQALPGPP